MSQVNVINNAGKDINITVNGNSDKIDIVIDLVKDFKLSRNLQPGDTFKDTDGDEYILLYYSPNGDAAILRKESLKEMKFSETNNNYDGSNIDKYLCDTYLPELERKFGKENIVEHDVDLLSLDGEDDYGVIKRKVSLLTFDEYRRNKKTIKKYIKNWFWLCTPDSTPSGYGSGHICYVGSDSSVRCRWYDCVWGVRPFVILKDSAFE